jgi:hypothetical protein
MSASTHDLVRELRAAHDIILAALSLMTAKQRVDLGVAVEDLGLTGADGGITRYHERDAVLACAAAEGQA